MSMHQVKYVYDKVSPDESVTKAILLTTKSLAGTDDMNASRTMIANLSNRNSQAVLQEVYFTYIVDVYDLTVPEEVRKQKLAFYGISSLDVRVTVADYFEQQGLGRLVKFNCRRGELNDAEDKFTYFRRETDVRSVKVVDLVDLRDMVSVSNHNSIKKLETV